MQIIEIHKEKIERMMQKTFVKKWQLISNIQGRDHVTNSRKLRKHKVEKSHWNIEVINCNKVYVEPTCEKLHKEIKINGYI